MNRTLTTASGALLRSVSIAAIMFTSAAYAQSAKEFAPGQSEAVQPPRQVAQSSDQPARKFAPGQVKKMSDDEDTTDDDTTDEDMSDDDGNKNSARAFAPGQTGDLPPGLAAKKTGEPASSFAPGQMKDDMDDGDDPDTDDGDSSGNAGGNGKGGGNGNGGSGNGGNGGGNGNGGGKGGKD